MGVVLKVHFAVQLAPLQVDLAVLVGLKFGALALTQLLGEARPGRLRGARLPAPLIGETVTPARLRRATVLAGRRGSLSLLRFGALLRRLGPDRRLLPRALGPDARGGGLRPQRSGAEGRFGAGGAVFVHVVGQGVQVAADGDVVQPVVGVLQAAPAAPQGGVQPVAQAVLAAGQAAAVTGQGAAFLQEPLHCLDALVHRQQLLQDLHIHRAQVCLGGGADPDKGKRKTRFRRERKSEGCKQDKREGVGVRGGGMINQRAEGLRATEGGGERNGQTSVNFLMNLPPQHYNSVYSHAKALNNE